MAALPSNVAGLVNANSAIGSETKRIADLPANVFFFSIFLRDIVFHNNSEVCGLGDAKTKAKFIYQDFLPIYPYRAQARKAIAGLGLEEPEDVVAIVTLFCDDTAVVQMAERIFVRGAAGTPRASGGVSDRSTGPRRRSQP
jgi:hypothetical protein